MAQAVFHFPRGFLWGAATAAHQVEGGNINNNWWAWEEQEKRILQGHKSGLACDWWNGRWREDIERAVESGHNAHRLSVEWSRIQPAPDRWDEEALDRYLEILRGLRERNITALVTLHHFSDPLWLSDAGGWENKNVVEKFGKYVHKTVDALKDYVSIWCTINEPNVYAVNGYVTGAFPPGKHNPFLMMRVLANMILGHAAAYKIIHSIQPTARVGIALNYRSMVPTRSWSPLDRWVRNAQAGLFNDLFPQALKRGKMRTFLGVKRIKEAKGAQDYLGVNYYTRDYVSFNLLKPAGLFARRYYRPGAALSDTGFIANEPEGMFEALKWALQFKVPIIVSENGVEDADDHLRPSYLAQHIHQMWRAVNFNYPIKGYFHWTLVDNFEWERGWTQRFGLWELNVESQARRKRPSADFYAEICRENGLSADMVARYAPEIFEQMFPN